MPNAASTAAILADIARRKAQNPLAAFLNQGADAYQQASEKTAARKLQKMIADKQAELQQQQIALNERGMKVQEGGQKFNQDQTLGKQRDIRADMTTFQNAQKPYAPDTLIGIPGAQTAIMGEAPRPPAVYNTPEGLNLKLADDQRMENRADRKAKERFTEQEANRRFGLLREQLDLAYEDRNWDRVKDLIDFQQRALDGTMKAQEFNAGLAERAAGTRNLDARTDQIRASTKAMLALEASRTLDAALKAGKLAGLDPKMVEQAWKNADKAVEANIRGIQMSVEDRENLRKTLFTGNLKFMIGWQADNPTPDLPKQEDSSENSFLDGLVGKLKKALGED